MNPTDEEIEKFANLMVADHNFDNLPKEVAVKRASIQTAKWARDLKRPWMIEISDILYADGLSAKQKVAGLQEILEHYFG